MKSLSEFLRSAKKYDPIIVTVNKTDKRNLYGIISIIKTNGLKKFPFICQDTTIVHKDDSLAGILEETKDSFEENDAAVDKIINTVNNYHRNKKDILPKFFKQGIKILNEEGVENFINFVEENKQIDVSPKT